MFCPRCGQQGLADVRFCPRCGLPLNLIAEITANNGVAPGTEDYRAPSTRSSRQKGIRIGTILILTSVVLAPLFFALSILADGPGPLLGPLTIFLTGLSVVLYARSFGDNVSAYEKPRPFQLVQPANRPMLPSPERPSIDGLGSRKVDTSDMAEPPSVTDHTTQFFD